MNTDKKIWNANGDRIEFAVQGAKNVQIDTSLIDGTVSIKIATPSGNADPYTYAKLVSVLQERVNDSDLKITVNKNGRFISVPIPEGHDGVRKAYMEKLSRALDSINASDIVISENAAYQDFRTKVLTELAEQPLTLARVSDTMDKFQDSLPLPRRPVVFGIR